MSLISVRAAIKSTLATALSSATLYEHGGTFDLDAVKRYARRSPAAVVAILGARIEFQGGITVALASFGVFCLANEASTTKRDVAATLLAESVAVELYSNNWGDVANGSPKKPAMANLHSHALDKIGVAMWVVKWEQQVDLQRNTIADLDDFFEFRSEYDISGDDDDDTTNTTDTTELDGPE